VLNFLGRGYFFATGHHTQFNRLQYSAAFVGLDDFDFLAGGALLLVNTFGTELVFALTLPLYLLEHAPSDKKRPGKTRRDSASQEKT
jgi:GPI ethanolamine phosphate transferase 3 subunit O